MEPRVHVTTFRVRYHETDQMQTFANARALEWFEYGRTEWLRSAGLSYAEFEKRGVFLPVVEAHLEYGGRARYDDLLRATTRAGMTGRVRVRFDVEIVQADGGTPVVRGYTVHAVTGPAGKPVRPEAWLLGIFACTVEGRGATVI